MKRPHPDEVEQEVGGFVPQTSANSANVVCRLLCYLCFSLFFIVTHDLCFFYSAGGLVRLGIPIALAPKKTLAL